MPTKEYNGLRNNIEEQKRPGNVVKAQDWNALFNMLALQANDEESYISALYDYLFENKTIPDTDVHNKLGMIDLSIGLKENWNNKTTVISSESTDTQYPSAKAVYDELMGKSDTGHTHAWSAITDKPASYPPSLHTQEWSTILNKPSSYPPAAHNHNDLYYGKTYVDTALSEKSDVGHDHDSRYYKKENVDLLLEGRAPVNHTHDDRYYLKTEVNTLLSGKADSNHVHTWTAITDKPTAYPPETHDHNSLYYLRSQVDSLISDMATKTWVEGKGYATTSYVNNHHDSTKQDLITSTNKLSYSLVSGTPTNVSSFTNDAGYLTLATLPVWDGGYTDGN